MFPSVGSACIFTS